MVLDLEVNGTLRLAGARDVRVEVVAGKVWLTQSGRREDRVLGSGARCRADAEGLVLVALDGPARLDLSAGDRAPWWKRLARRWERALQSRRAARELSKLPDRLLRDVGLSRDRIREVV